MSLVIRLLLNRLLPEKKNYFEVPIRNRTRPRALVTNRHTRELTGARKTSGKHNNK